MSFWRDISTYAGNTPFGVVPDARLALEVGQGGWVAGLNMYTRVDGGDYILTNEKSDDAVETVSVYFLSWKVDDTSKVSFETLKNYNYFMTSEFSGCRFVVTNYGVAHVAWSAGGNRSMGLGSQALRDSAEATALSYDKFPPKYRRRLSTTGGLGTLDSYLGRIGSNNAGQSYNNERALVFGYRVSGGWAFKVLRYNAGQPSSSGYWSNFACVWAS